MKRSRVPSKLHATAGNPKAQKTTITSRPTLASRLPAKATSSTLHRAATIKTPSKTTNTDDDELFLVFEVFWTKRSTKKNKTYSDGTEISRYFRAPLKIINIRNPLGILVVRGRKCSLRDMEGKEIGKTQSYSVSTLSDLKEGNTLEVGAKELEVCIMRKEQVNCNSIDFVCRLFDLPPRMISPREEFLETMPRKQPLPLQ